jgi:hypothetical protein
MIISIYTLSGSFICKEISIDSTKNYDEFINYLSKIDSIKKILDNNIIKYIYNEIVINNEIYENFIKFINDEIIIIIVIQKLPKICTTHTAFAIINNDNKVITWVILIMVVIQI